MSAVSEGVVMESFEGFVESALPRLVRFAGWVAGPSGDAEDLVQDALERVGGRWTAIASRPGDPEAYVRRAIVNGHVSRWRTRRREHLVDAVPDGSRVWPPGEDPRHGSVWRAVQSLPKGQRAVIALRFFEDMSVTATARALGVSDGTVKIQTSRALDALRRTIAQGDGDGDERTVLALARSAAAAASPVVIAVPGAGAQLAEGVAARRRRRTAAVGGALAVAVAALVSVLVWSPWRGVDRIQPVVPAPSVQEATPTATAASPTPSAAAEASVPAPGAVTATTAPPTSTQATQATQAAQAVLDLGTYRLLLQDSPANIDTTIDRRDALDTPWPIDPCRPTTYASDAKRLDFVAVSYFLGDSGEGTFIARYADPATASDVLAGFGRAVDGCGRTGQPQPAEGSDLVQWRVPAAPVLGDESLYLQANEYSTGFGPPGTDFMAVRLGSYVLMTDVDSMYARSSTDEARLAGVTQTAQQELAKLQAALEGGQP